MGSSSTRAREKQARIEKRQARKEFLEGLANTGTLPSGNGNGTDTGNGDDSVTPPGPQDCPALGCDSVEQITQQTVQIFDNQVELVSTVWLTAATTIVPVAPTVLGATGGLTTLGLTGAGAAGKASAAATALATTVAVMSDAVQAKIAARGITESMVNLALRKGVTYFDPKNQAIIHILHGGFASGKSLYVARVPFTNIIKTAIPLWRVPSRLIPFP